ncbi:hypothetical protein KP509_15G023600 [Ceratopteris richardii]|uniref:Uncharacterized protein n=1 Tax=Ceratopteris richardii TaxID=49495 RepID=A0A8T2T648_CERRI|nr:hypothetical protein KP509_15G023600 [Ceratopteris richardii]
MLLVLRYCCRWDKRLQLSPDIYRKNQFWLTRINDLGIGTARFLEMQVDIQCKPSVKRQDPCFSTEDSVHVKKMNDLSSKVQAKDQEKENFSVFFFFLSAASFLVCAGFGIIVLV